MRDPYLRTLPALLLLANSQRHPPIAIATEFIENIVYAYPVTKAEVRLKFYTDTGGGDFIFRGVVDVLHLPVLRAEIEGKSVEEITLPPFADAAAVPQPIGSQGKLMVLAASERPTIFDSDTSGLLGQRWFADRIWTWDYPAHQLLLRAEGDLPAVPAANRISLGFILNEQRQRVQAVSLTRINITIDGASIDMLFDTGANTVLTRRALRAVDDGHAAHRATSFIVRSIFERWHRKHPEWRIVYAAEEHTGARIIEVPAIQIGGYTVGPVWFTERPDENFTHWMSQWMDKTVYGALGGSALQYLRITVDFRSAMAYCERALPQHQPVRPGILVGP